MKAPHSANIAPRIIVFSSGKTDRVADGVRENLSREHGGVRYDVDVWKDGYFNENNVLPLNTFLKKLLCYDVAALVLGNDELRRKDATRKQAEWVPRDNVIFELGAAMARMGTRKTFILTPREPKVVLPTYFSGLNPLIYESRVATDPIGGTGAACAIIRETLRGLEADVFHSDLPAIGLAHGYFFNFVNAIYTTLHEPQDLGGTLAWRPQDGYTLTIMVPETLMNRQSADKFLIANLGAANLHLRLRDGRDVSIYCLSRSKSRRRLHIVDIPTTLLTSAEVIERVDSFWGAGDAVFKKLLTDRERDSFQRHLRFLCTKMQIDSDKVFIVRQADLSEHLAKLRRARS
jgi:hypothetical protein